MSKRTGNIALALGIGWACGFIVVAASSFLGFPEWLADAIAFCVGFAVAYGVVDATRE